MSLHFLSHDIPNLLPRIPTLFIYQATWTILCRPLPSPYPTTATTFNHTSVRHGISILQMVAASTKIALHTSVFWGVALYDPYTECHAMKKDGVTICNVDVLILRVSKISRNMRATWYMMWYKCRKAWQWAIFLLRWSKLCARGKIKVTLTAVSHLETNIHLVCVSSRISQNQAPCKHRSVSGVWK